jgi:hypothetical protein
VSRRRPNWELANLRKKPTLCILDEQKRLAKDPAARIIARADEKAARGALKKKNKRRRAKRTCEEGGFFQPKYLKPGQANFARHSD